MAFTEPWPAPRCLDLSLPLPEEGARVSLREASTGWPGSVFLLSRNSLNPVLRFYEDGVETRVIRTARHRYADIALAEADTSLFSKTPSTLQLTWANGGFQFWARPTMRSHLAAMLRLLADKGVPLGPVARALLPAGAAAPRR